jgi:hypothetical protein
MMRKEDNKFEDSLCYIVRPCLKNNNQPTKKRVFSIDWAPVVIAEDRLLGVLDVVEQNPCPL